MAIGGLIEPLHRVVGIGKKIVEVKDRFKHLIDIPGFIHDEYTIKNGYHLLCSGHHRFQWCSEVWGRLNIPKHSVIMWLATLDRLKTKQRLLNFQMVNSSTYLFCDIHEESVTHLFFECHLSKICIKKVKEKMGSSAKSEDLRNLLRWISRAPMSKFHKMVYAAFVAAVVYHIWKARNEVFLLFKVRRIDLIVNNIINDVKNRVQGVMPKTVSSIDREWFDSL
ncbi:uncharacterized protein LOC133791578 [Humulus lupulus]|uniref:uncharacterized protein LOC133791578 n=1 Tax=Humulus lupulus TaxID=3486 RepID=UPI002B40BA58|nr:uncharacterized protein LOC133791578 [Humulus lupulus]